LSNYVDHPAIVPVLSQITQAQKVTACEIWLLCVHAD